MEERMVPQPPTKDGALPLYREGQSYRDHAEHMLLDLFRDLRGLMHENSGLAGDERVAAAGIALAACETMYELAQPTTTDDEPKPESDGERRTAIVVVARDEEESDEDIGWRWWRPWRRR